MFTACWCASKCSMTDSKRVVGPSKCTLLTQSRAVSKLIGLALGWIYCYIFFRHSFFCYLGSCYTLTFHNHFVFAIVFPKFIRSFFSFLKFCTSYTIFLYLITIVSFCYFTGVKFVKNRFVFYLFILCCLDFGFYLRDSNRSDPTQAFFSHGLHLLLLLLHKKSEQFTSAFGVGFLTKPTSWFLTGISRDF